MRNKSVHYYNEYQSISAYEGANEGADAGANDVLINRTNENFNWIVQEYIEGMPVSCTTISNGQESITISVNRQIIGLNFLNTPKEFVYCGNVVPARRIRDIYN